ncbi:hypothetical protein FND36_10110 [Lachnospiraceae bacterium KGMB03038]|nr:hypothetical protein FND36_10110 [Lachnospiraceae bacterium KGMB03038]
MKHQGTWGSGGYILQTGQMLEPQVQSSNEIRIRDGAMMIQGALSTVKVNSYDPVTIQNGTQGMKRIDLICWQYTYDAEQDVESAEWVVIQGTPAETDPQQPAYTDGDIQQGDSPVQVPVFAVELDGINVTGVTTLLPTAPTLEELNDKLDEKIIVQRYSNRINVSNGQNSYTAINVNIPDGYTIIGISAYALHATTLCGGGAYDSNNNRIVIPFSAHDSVTPETFYVDLTLMVE